MKSSLTTTITLDVDQTFALSYALSLAILAAKTQKDDKLLKALKSIDEMAEDRISALG